MTASEPVRIEMTLPAPLPTVWEAFRNPAEIRRWFGWDYDGLEEEIRLIFEGETEASEADRSLQVGGHRFSFDERGDQTVVTVVRSTPASGDGDWAGVYDDIEEGWLTFLQQLRFLLERHRSENRRTVYASGPAVDPHLVPLPELVGISAVAAAAPGTPYEGTAAWGEPVTGVVWFRSPLQLGITVDAWGDGLLILSQSPSAPPPQSAASLVATTYGLDDATFDALQQRLTTWWSAHFAAQPAEASSTDD